MTAWEIMDTMYGVYKARGYKHRDLVKRAGVPYHTLRVLASTGFEGTMMPLNVIRIARALGGRLALRDSDGFLVAENEQIPRYVLDILRVDQPDWTEFEEKTGLSRQCIGYNLTGRHAMRMETMIQAAKWRDMTVTFEVLEEGKTA